MNNPSPNLASPNLEAVLARLEERAKTSRNLARLTEPGYNRGRASGLDEAAGELRAALAGRPAPRY